MRIKFLLLLIALSTSWACLRTPLIGNRENRDIRIIKPYKGTVSIPFDLINNLAVIPLRINDSDTLKFVLDTGVGRTIITELGVDQSFNIKYTGEIDLRGLGNAGPIPALISNGNEIFLEGIEGENHSVVLLLEGVFSLSSFMGTQVNGLIGYDIFKNFIVEIDYQRKKLFFHDPDAFKNEYEELKNSDDWYNVPVDVQENKLYVETEILQSDSSTLKSRLIVDSGASHTLFLYPGSSDEVHIPENTIESYLGSGLAGEIYGRIGRAHALKLDDLELNNVVVSYPNSEDIQQALNLDNRNGSLGADVLRRFRVIFNYDDASMLLKPNNFIEDDFTYNISGIEVITPFLNLPYFVVAIVRPNSPAEKAGIREGDVIYEIGYKRVYKYTLNDIIELFQTPNERIRIIVQRGADLKKIDLVLEDKTRLRNN